jgi:TolB-like protein/Tfp pilus assembly protein PilF
MENGMSLFTELKRRNVFRAGLAYLVSAWIFAQVADLVLSSFKAPDWIMQVLLVFLGLGFIGMVIFSWAYELTPDGIKRDADVSADDSIADHTAKKLNYITIVAASIVVVLFIYQQISPSTTLPNDKVLSSTNSAPIVSTDANESRKKTNSIAVLPFADMSREGDQEYFADGISEEILNVIVRIPNLQVAGRTSSFSFKGKNEDLRMIGESLGVDHILEGSVRRSASTLRITAQLIRSTDGFHLWSETYDREIADIFDIQDEIAQKVADQLVISMGLQLKTKAQNRTADLVVYEDYLKAKQLFEKRGRENLDKALVLLNEATTRDPNYAPAWTLKALIFNVYNAYVEGEERWENAEKWHAESKYAAQKALALDPNAAEAYIALGSVYFDSYDFIQAFENYNRAIELAPDNPIILDSVAQNTFEIGYFQKAKTLSEKAVGIDPLVAIYRNTLGNINYALGFEAEAFQNFEKSIELDPSLPFPYDNLETIYFRLETSEQFQAISLRRKEAGLNETFTSRKFRFIQENGGLKNRDIVRRLRDEADDNPTKWYMTGYLRDVDYAIDMMDNYWKRESRPRRYPLHYPFKMVAEFIGKDRWREQLRIDGVLALWQANGFPEHCKPVGQDDFECVDPRRSE